MTREEAKEIISRHHWAFASMDDEVIEAIECLAEDCEDAISRATAIKEIQDRRLFTHVTKDGWFWLADEKVILNVLNGLPSVTPKQSWIPVSERLPNFAGTYLVTRYFPNNVMNPEYLVDACFFDGSDTWHNDNRINHERKYLTNVVAWLEEPEPYKAESEDKE